MTHEFHAHGSTLQQSEQALTALLAAIQWTEGRVFDSIKETELNGLGSVFNKANLKTSSLSNILRNHVDRQNRQHAREDAL